MLAEHRNSDLSIATSTCCCKPTNKQVNDAENFDDTALDVLLQEEVLREAKKEKQRRKRKIGKGNIATEKRSSYDIAKESVYHEATDEEELLNVLPNYAGDDFETLWTKPKQQEKREKQAKRHHERKLLEYRREMERKEQEAHQRMIESKRKRHQRERKARELQQKQVQERQLLRRQKEEQKQGQVITERHDGSPQDFSAASFDLDDLDITELSPSLFSPRCPFSPTASPTPTNFRSTPVDCTISSPIAIRTITPSGVCIIVPSPSSPAISPSPEFAFIPIQPEVARQPLRFKYDALPHAPKAKHPPLSVVQSAFEAANQKAQVTVSLVHECPVSLEPVTEPVIAWDGHTYEKSVLTDWMNACKKAGRPLTSPKTGAKMKWGYRSNHVLKPQVYSHTTGGW